MGEAAAGGAKQKKNMAADGRNRRALGDIGNLTKAVPVNVDGAPIVVDGVAAAAGRGGAAVPKAAAAQKKVTVKPKPDAVIEISPDTEEKEEAQKEKKPVIVDNNNNNKKTGEGSSRKKKAQTLTSILTARSKAACGLSNKQKEQVFDIDAGDINNELAVVEYVEDMYKFYKLVENESRVHDYMEMQPEINEKMRAILADWLIEVHNKFELTPETLYLTLNIVDRFLASNTLVLRKELQLVGIAAMLMASKYEEIWAPEVYISKYL
ncbi:hypothetical protein U1Q18_013820 [Sarracenia purpurea var. burkii]